MKNLVIVKEAVSGCASGFLHQHRIEKLLVVDDDYHCVGLITVKDMEMHCTPMPPEQGCLRVAAATTVVMMALPACVRWLMPVLICGC